MGEVVVNYSEMNCSEIREYLDRIENDGELEKILEKLSSDKRVTVLRLVNKHRKLIEKRREEKKRLQTLWNLEKGLFQQGFKYIAGIDEAGRGPLAGPVVASAVILPPLTLIPGLNDSKKVKEQDRKLLAEEIKGKALGWAVGVVDAQTIDEINILEATRLAMELALNALKPKAEYVLVDGYPNPRITIPQKGVVNGDSLSASIAAASIIAKVHRDYLMETYEELYPYYFFSQHKGYGTAIHLEALEAYGPCFIHRKTFKPISNNYMEG